MVLSLFVFGAVLAAGALKLKAQFGPPSPERQAAMAKQKALEEATPQLKFTEEVLPLSIPDHTIGETEGVSINSKGHLFVYSRTGKGGSSRGGTAAELFEFDQNYKFVKMWGPDNYAASFAHSVRNDKYDNVWMVDEGSGMIVKFDPNGIVRMTLGRKTEAIDYLERYMERGEKSTERYPVGTMGTFNRETDIAWDSQDNMYISDGYGNSRVVKIAKDGVWQKAVGTHGSGDNQFSTPHGISTDAQGNVYVADRGNFRIQVYDSDLNFKKSIGGVAAPWTVQVTPKYIYSGDGTGKIYRLDHDGKLLGWIQSGMGMGQTGCIIHELYAVNDNELIRGSCSEWDVTKITFK
jgi:DNA-binding beta-propeller fold protein YncE